MKTILQGEGARSQKLSSKKMFRSESTLHEIVGGSNQNEKKDIPLMEINSGRGEQFD